MRTPDLDPGGLEAAAEAIRNDMGCEFWHDGEASLCMEHDATREEDEMWGAAPYYAKVALEAAAPMLMAQAWDEGARAQAEWHHAERRAASRFQATPPALMNPYRKETP